MSALNVTYPIKAGSIRAVLNMSSNGTDWTDLTSASFYDSTTGAACASGLRFAWIGVVNLSLDSLAHVKYRAAEAVDDPTTHEIPVFPYSIHADDLATLRDSILTVSVKKAAAGDVFVVLAGFDKE